MIVVEGADGTGKTTLVQRISDDLGLSVGSRGVANRDELYKVTKQDTYMALARAVEGRHPPYVWDRLFFSESIYSRVMGRPNQFKSADTQFVTKILKALRCPVIICHVPLDVATENMEAAHQMEEVSENYPYIHGAYEGLRMATTDWTHSFDYRVEGATEEVLDLIKHYLVGRKDREWR